MATSQDFWNWVCGPDLLPEYLNYQFKAIAPELRALNMGSTHQTIYQRDAAGIEVLVPPVDVQRAIADYLDRETARIDTLIDEQQRLIELLLERRDSVWSRGLESAYSCGPPVPIKRVLASIADGPFGSSLTSAHYSDEGTRVIRLGNIGMCEFRDSDAAYIPTAYAEELSEHAVNAGDVVIAGLGDDRMPLGRATVVPDLGPAIVKADCYRARPTGAVTSSYLAWALTAPQTRSQIMLLSRGATRARLNTSVVQQVEIPVPSREFQTALVSEWAERTANIDALIAESETFIELSRERRSALITAAVTGQIDVRGVA
jgi:type I restriction enzyme S subunit